MTTILCVEDSDNNAFILRRMLQRAGFGVLVAATAGQAIEVARTERPDLILMDLVLPGTDGYSATRRLKELPETAAIPVIAVSAHTEAERGNAARSAGCAAYVSKPIHPRTLLGTIQSLLDARATADTNGSFGR